MNWRQLVKANDDIESAEISYFKDIYGQNVRHVNFYDFVDTDDHSFLIIADNGDYTPPEYQNIDKEYQPMIEKFLEQDPEEWFDCPKLYNIVGADFANDAGFIRFPAYAHYERNGRIHFYVNPETDSDWLHDERYLFTRKQIDLLKKGQLFRIQKAIDLETTEHTSTD